MMNKILNEDMDADALRGLIRPLISIDQYKSKMGEDKDIVVVCFKVKDKFPAKDLSRFIEFGDKSLLDVEVSSGSDKETGDYKVYVEIQRDRKLFDRLDSLLNDIKNLDSKINKWMFLGYKTALPKEWNRENFDDDVISDKQTYVITHDENAREITERINFLKNYK